MVAEQLDAKTIAHTKVLQFGSTTQVAKIAGPIMCPLQGVRGIVGCEEHCKYEDTAVWQYDPGCKNWDAKIADNRC